ncbi:MAG: lipopolysaccharide biosynthesis protein [Planctomycetaceae bacterium]
MILGSSFRRSILHGASWSTLGTLGTQVVNTGLFLVLGRFYMQPEDFGVIAIILLLTGFASIFVELGFTAALIQRNDLEESHRSSVFWLGLLVGAAVQILFCVSRDRIAVFYARPELSLMIPWSSFVFLLSSLSSVHVALLKRELNFAAIAVSNVLSQLTGAIVALFLASSGAGAWSLVAKTVLAQFVLTVAVWIACSWRPKPHFSRKALNDVFAFSAGCFGTRLFSHLAVKVDELILGKYVSVSALGLYSSAVRIVMLPISLVKSQIVSVFFPALSSIQNDHQRVKSISLRLSSTLAVAGFPVLFFLAGASRSLILALLDPSWLEMQHVLIMLSLIGAMEISIFPGVIYMSQGNSEGYFRLMIGAKSVTSAGIILGVMLGGLNGLLAGMLAASALNYVPYLYFSGRLIGMTVWEQLKVNAFPYFASAFAAVVVFQIECSEPNQAVSALLLQLFVFGGIIGVAYVLARPYPIQPSLTYTLRLIRQTGP